MQSTTKISLSNPKIEEMARIHFGNQVRLRDASELTDGWFNTAYRFELRDGLIGVLKVAPSPDCRVMRYERNIMSAEVAAMKLVHELNTVPLPEIYCFDCSHTLVESDYFMMSFLPGMPLDKARKLLSIEDQHEIERQAGRYTRLINDIHEEGFGLLGQNVRFSTWAEAFNGLICDLLQDGQDLEVKLPLPYAEIFSRLQAFYPALDIVRHPCLVHWDLWDGNIFVDLESKQITGLIDFERALWADPLMEAYYGEFTDSRWYAEGYGRDLKAEPQAVTRRKLYNLYLQLVMVIESAFRGYSAEHRQWTLGRLDKGLKTL
jgi:aminoglycoside phosphotransferase (APT) family kinase protein